MGFQYELLKQLAKELGVELEILVANGLDEVFEKLRKQECDLIALDLTITKDRKKIVNFTEPYEQTTQVLVQRKPDGWQKMRKSEIEELLIRNQIDLSRKKVFIQKNSSHFDRLKNLSDEIGDSIFIMNDHNLAEEQLVSMVSKGDIDYTICDEHVAQVNQRYYPNIDISTPISFPQNLAWAVRKDSDSLLAEINRWIIGFKKTRKYKYLHRKYFENPKSVYIVQSEFYSLKSGKISRYDEDIKKYCKELDWDWRLVASLMYQESHFDPNAKSWAGAFGIMQLMPATAARYGIDSLSTTSQHIYAGIRFLMYLDKQISKDIKDKEERIKFVLASYNAGMGHVIDARNLAKKFNKDSTKWDDNVDTFLLLKAIPKYFRDPVVKYGYLRGEESYKFVREIMERYEHYKNIVKK